MRHFLILLALSFSTLAACQTATADTVYVTETGVRYHTESCRYLKYSKKEITLKEAQKVGYTPCKVCYRSSANNTTVKSNKTTTHKNTSTRCQATTQKGTQCKRTASAGSSRCWQH